jgi:hypothetical protein
MTTTPKSTSRTRQSDESIAAGSEPSAMMKAEICAVLEASAKRLRLGIEGPRNAELLDSARATIEALFDENARLQSELIELRADRDSWRDQCTDRIADWGREHDLRIAAESELTTLRVENERLLCKMSEATDLMSSQLVSLAKFRSAIADSERRRMQLLTRAEKADSDLAALRIENDALRSESLALRSRLERAEGDARRLSEYLMGRCEANDTHRDAIFQCELRQISGDYPTLDEWRIAIDTALAAHPPEPSLAALSQAEKRACFVGQEGEVAYLLTHKFAEGRHALSFDGDGETAEWSSGNWIATPLYAKHAAAPACGSIAGEGATRSDAGKAVTDDSEQLQRARERLLRLADFYERSAEGEGDISRSIYKSTASAIRKFADDALSTQQENDHGGE